MLRSKIFFVFMCALLFGVSAPAQAQFSSEENPVSIILTPSYPRPYQTIVVSPRSTLIDLSASQVVISSNGVVVQRGTGTQSASVTAGASGQVTAIVVSVTAPNGKVYKSGISVRPADVALVVEPATTAHPFYKGLTLTAAEGRVRLIAIPDLRTSNNVAIDASKLVYTWKLGSKVLQDASGIGRSVLVATAPVRYRDADITVLVTSQDSSVVAEAQTTISPRDPLVRIYPYDPLLGTDYDHALLSNFSLSSTEASFRAVPYFFASSPSIEWSVGGVAQGTQRDITVRTNGSGKGTATLEVKTKLANSFQLANARAILKYGEGKSPLSIFGF